MGARIAASLDQTRKEKPMADNTQRTGSPDSKRINLEQDYEVRYWSKELGVTPERLREAVKAAGTSVEAVRKHLGGN
jgi:hypothetical protein